MIEDLSAVKALSWDEQSAWCKIAVPRNESLEAFFGDLGLHWFLCGIPCGGYGIDWGFWEGPGEFEASIKSSALLYANDPPERRYWTPLYHATGMPKMTWSKLSNCEMGMLECGKIQKPEIIVDGLRYTFDTVAWRDGAFVIRSKVARVEAEFDSTAGMKIVETPVQEREDTVAALREVLHVVSAPVDAPVVPPAALLQPAKQPWYRRLWSRRRT